MQIPTQRYDLLTKRTILMKFRVIITYICLILIGFSSSASPARRGQMVLTQPDGTTFIATFHGDEFAKIKTTAAGQAIIQDEEGWWCYATYETDGSICNSGWKVGQDTPSSVLTRSCDIPKSTISEFGAKIKMSSNEFTDGNARASL